MSGEARVVWMPGGVRTEVHLGAQETGGAFCLLVDHPPAGWSLSPHRHRNESETILVLEGEFEMEIDGERVVLCAGESVHVPSGVVHSGANVGARTGRRVLVFSPAGMESFFLAAGAGSRDHEPDAREVLSRALEHGWEFPSEG